MTTLSTFPVGTDELDELDVVRREVLEPATAIARAHLADRPDLSEMVHVGLAKIHNLAVAYLSAFDADDTETMAELEARMRDELHHLENLPAAVHDVFEILERAEAVAAVLLAEGPGRGRDIAAGLNKIRELYRVYLAELADDNSAGMQETEDRMRDELAWLEALPAITDKRGRLRRGRRAVAIQTALFRGACSPVFRQLQPEFERVKPILMRPRSSVPRSIRGSGRAPRPRTRRPRSKSPPGSSDPEQPPPPPRRSPASRGAW
jgi:hypothetical protein